MPEELIILKPAEAEELFLRVLQKHEASKNLHENRKTYSINKAAKLLGRHHNTLKKLIRTGQINSTTDGRITEHELRRYLDSKK